MKIYLVGGAVRDELLGLDVTERDWVVVGSTPKEMLKEGFNQVGKSFPVFLHPKTGEEYALARTEKKTGKGYYGFECDASTKVTLEDDLLRRDLTINAIAKDEAGNIVDPFGGQKDLENKILKHVSSAFVEDPVRLLRVARFMARFEPMGFKIDKSTLSLMQEMVELGEVDALVPERVFKEMQRALSLPSPVSFIRTLRASGALQKILPEVDRLYGVPQTPKYHPEIDTGIHTEMVLEQAARLSQDPEVRFAAMLHDVGKGTTAVDILPSHHGHEQRGEKLIKSLCKRLKVPANFRDLAVYVAKFHGNVHRAFELKPSTVVSILERVDAFRRPARFEQFLLACEADSRGRKGFEANDYPQAQYLRDALVACMEIDIKAILDTNARGDVIKKRIHDARVSAVKALSESTS